MKVRIKFSKTGSMKFVGHLDTMRYFQKAVRRAGLPAAFSKGFSPHMIMSFASPLGVGTESEGEYFDIELREDVPTKEIEDSLNRVMAEGVSVVCARRVEDGKAGNAMSLVAAADYNIAFREGKAPEGDLQSSLTGFLSQPEIIITKTTKTGEKNIDIRPYIYEMHAEGERIFCKLAAASANYTKPETVMQAFFDFLGQEMKPYACMVTRLELYADKGTEEEHSFVPLYSLGEIVWQQM